MGQQNGFQRSICLCNYNDKDYYFLILETLVDYVIVIRVVKILEESKNVILFARINRAQR